MLANARHVAEEVRRRHVTVWTLSSYILRAGGVGTYTNNSLSRHAQAQYCVVVEGQARLTEGLEIFDGHKLECSWSLGWRCCCNG